MNSKLPKIKFCINDLISIIFRTIVRSESEKKNQLDLQKNQRNQKTIFYNFLEKY